MYIYSPLDHDNHEFYELITSRSLLMSLFTLYIP